MMPYWLYWIITYTFLLTYSITGCLGTTQDGLGAIFETSAGGRASIHQLNLHH